VHKRMILLNPGPVTLSARVRNALSAGDWCHRESEFADLTREINSRLVGVYADMRDDFESVMMTGSGTSAVEAMLASFAPAEGSTLVLANGIYGERMAQILRAQRKPHELLQQSWTAALPLDEVARLLDRQPEISHIATVQHETTTGRLNDIDGVGALCRERKLMLLLDGVSSFGAERVDAGGWNLQALAGTANKCLHGVPGLSFVIAHRDAWSRPPANTGSVYLNLFGYHSAQHGSGYSPFTQAIQVAFALREALQEHDEAGGWQSRRALYRQRAAQTHTQLSELNVETLLDVDAYGSVLRSYRLPVGITYQSLHDALKQQGFIIYAGQGELAQRIFRLAYMGDIQPADLEALSAALRSALAPATTTNSR